MDPPNGPASATASQENRNQRRARQRREAAREKKQGQIPHPQSPREQPNEVEQNQDSRSREAPVTGASESLPHTPEKKNPPSSVGASHSGGGGKGSAGDLSVSQTAGETTSAGRGAQSKHHAQLVVGTQCQNLQQQPRNLEGESSPRKQSKGVEQNNTISDLRQLLAAGASNSSPDIIGNPPKPVGASNSEGGQGSTTNTRGNQPTVNSQEETTEPNNGCGSAGTADPACGSREIRAVSDAEAAQLLPVFIRNFISVETLKKHLVEEQQRYKAIERSHSALLVMNNSHSKKERQFFQEREYLHASLRTRDEEIRKMLCERQSLKCQHYEVALHERKERERSSEELKIAKSQIQEKEEHEMAFVKEREEEMSRIKREHEEREGKLQAEKTELRSQLRKKESEERALLKETQDATSAVRRQHEERVGQIQVEKSEMESRLHAAEEHGRALLALLKQKQDVISTNKRYNEEMVSQMQAAAADMRSQLLEKEAIERELRVELETAIGLVRQKEERERALIKEREEERKVELKVAS
ncbi:hypothetical protein DFP73DRAFT_634585, partial [Morchella snyderi]